ncbi:hypothetical protein LARI1_G006716 [Lachnellula arida]|uniref:Uncharacterized protein n=1 Tax=Lachnellula arida TaxID=1316785 RepID=A0A8T9B8W1_9HELO|nr:hypothetical protein LARI1_G006716 [Lachnellula arida]
MYFFSNFPSQAIAFLPFILSLPIGSCADDGLDLETSTSDGPTSDKSAGIGVQFKTDAILFRKGSRDCHEQSAFASQKKMVARRGSGQSWALTADTQKDTDVLDAEYIIDGRVVKIGSGDAGKAAAAIATDLAAWDSSTKKNRNSFNIDQSTCNRWTITTPDAGKDFEDIHWSPSVTAPLPLEAISDLFAKNTANQAHALLPEVKGRGMRCHVSRWMISVTKDFFQSSPNGISSTAVNDDVLGFFSLVVSYAKAAKSFNVDESPKMPITIIPRTDFTTIFAQVKGVVPGDLYDLVKVLACYKNNGTNVVIDTAYCSGTVQAPVTGTKMDKQSFTFNSSSDCQPQSLRVSDWIRGIQGWTVPDGLTTLDKLMDSSVGGLGTALEKLHGTSTRAVPLFEFRNLQNAKSGDFETRVKGYEQAVTAYHNAHLNVPRQIVKRVDAKYSYIKRAGSNAKACARKTSATINSARVTSTPASTPAPSCKLQKADPDSGIKGPFCVCESSTFPILSSNLATATGPDASCAYSTMPGSTAVVKITTTSLGPATTNIAICQVCTPQGVNQDSCTTIPNCAPEKAAVTVQAGTKPVHVGTLTGTALYSTVSSALESLCPTVSQTTSMTKCSETDTVSIEKIPYVDQDTLEHGKLDITVKSSQYNVTSLRDAMIHSAALTAQHSATGKNCYDANYQINPYRKRSILDWIRESTGLKAARDKPLLESKKINICTAGDFAGVQYFSKFWRTAAQPGATDYLDANLAFEKSGGDFACDFLTDLMDALVIVAPEFAEENVVLGENIKAICDDSG